MLFVLLALFTVLFPLSHCLCLSDNTSVSSVLSPLFCPVPSRDAVKQHPGGDAILTVPGGNATIAFFGHAHSDYAVNMKEMYVIGHMIPGTLPVPV
jgi:hypothetical protein